MRYVVSAAVLLSVFVPPQVGASSANEAGRLAALGRVWLLVKYAHPRVALGSTDWDGPVLKAIGEASKASDESAFADVVSRMLATLNDPLTRVKPPTASSDTSDSQQHASPRVSMLEQGLLIDLREGSALNDLAPTIKATSGAADADVFIVDTRGTRQTDVSAHQLSLALAPYLVSSPTHLPSPRSATVLPDRREQTLRASHVIEPVDGVRPRRSIFVVDATSVLPSLALSLQAEGLAKIVSVGGLPDLDEAVEKVDLPGGFQVQVRTQDSVLKGRRIELRPDAAFPVGTRDSSVYESTKALLSASSTLKPVDDPAPVNRPEPPYAEARYPNTPHRILAVYRFWGAVHYFFAYPHLMDRPWDAALEEFVQAARDAANELEYQQLIARMAARLQDSHVVWTGVPSLQRFLGGLAPQSAVVRMIEGKPVVAQIITGDATELGLGDEILAVDGESVADRIKRIEPFLSYSTPQSRLRLLGDRFLLGERGTRSRVQVRRDDSMLEVSTTERGPSYRRTSERTGPVVTLLEGNIGYVDVDRLEPADVDSAFKQLGGSRGMIFDMRGYPNGGTASAIARRVNRKGNPVVGQAYQPQLLGGWKVRMHMMHRLDAYGEETGSSYDKPVVVLIDERAQSAAEFFAQMLKTVADARLIGSPTAGANGETTSVILPGGVSVRYTRNDARTPTGEQFQRIGHQPDIRVLPTIEGLRAGRDEVLERAVSYLSTGK